MSCAFIDQYIREPLKYKGMALGLSLHDETLALLASDDKQAEVLEEVSRDQLVNTADLGTLAAFAQIHEGFQGRVAGTCLAVDSRYLSYARFTITDANPDDLSSWVISCISEMIPQGLDPHQIVIDFRVIAGLKHDHAQVVWGVRERLERLADSVLKRGFPAVVFYPAGLAVVTRDLACDEGNTPVLYFHSRLVLLLTFVDGVLDACSELGESCPEDASSISSLCDRIKAQIHKQTCTVHLYSAMSLPASLESRFRQNGLEVEIKVAASLACGAALQGLHISESPFVLLADQVPHIMQAGRDRLTALRTAVLGVLTLSLLYVLMLSASKLCEYWIVTVTDPRNTERRVIALSDTGNISKRMSTANLYSARKTNESLIRLLVSLRLSVPDSLWLSSLTLIRGPSGPDYRGNLSGETSNEVHMLDLIERLRSSNLWQVGSSLRAERGRSGPGFRREKAITPSVLFEIDLAGGLP